MSLAFNMPTTGTADLYAGVQGVGLYHATDAAGAWTLLSGSASGLPAQSAQTLPASWSTSAAESQPSLCRARPEWREHQPLCERLRADWFRSGRLGIAPNSDLYRFAFAVAPNSPGDGATDILIFSGVALYRSNNAGASWDACVDDPHHDHNCFGFSTLAPTPGEIPTVYVGCDGGLFASTSLADGTVDVTVYPSDFSDGLIYTPSGVCAELQPRQAEPCRQGLCRRPGERRLRLHRRPGHRARRTHRDAGLARPRQLVGRLGGGRARR